jgi:hypothetical protein
VSPVRRTRRPAWLSRMILWLIPLALQLRCDFSGVYEPNHRPLSRGGQIHERLWSTVAGIPPSVSRLPCGTRKRVSGTVSLIPFISLLLRYGRDSVYSLEDGQQSARPVTAAISPVFCVGGHTKLVDEIYI